MFINRNVILTAFATLLHKGTNEQGLNLVESSVEIKKIPTFKKGKLSMLLCLAFLLPVTMFAQSEEIEEGQGARASNVGYEHIGFTGAIKITYDLAACNEDDFYYVSVYHEEAEIGHITEASERAITGANRLNPMTCADEKEIIWDFSKEPKSKKSIGNGEFIVDVFTISASENKKLHKATSKYKKKINRLDRKILKAINKGRSKKLARLEKRKARKEKRYAKRFTK